MDEHNNQPEQQAMDIANNPKQKVLSAGVTQKKMSKTVVKKKGKKDFTREERDMIIERARKVGHIRAAKEAGASWHAVAS